MASHALAKDGLTCGGIALRCGGRRRKQGKNRAQFPKSHLLSSMLKSRHFAAIARRCACYLGEKNKFKPSHMLSRVMHRSGAERASNLIYVNLRK
jgi:hypothetical protein